MTRKVRKWTLFLIAGDLILIVLAAGLSLLIRFGRFGVSDPFPDPILDPYRVYTGATFFTSAVTLFCLHIAELHRIDQKVNLLAQTLRILFALAAASVILSFIFYWVPAWRLFRLSFIYHQGMLAPALIFWRWQFSRVIFPRLPRQRLLVAGGGRSGRMILEVIEAHPEFLLDPVGFIDDGEESADSLEGKPRLGASENLVTICRQRSVDLVVVATNHIRDPLMRALLECKSQGIAIRDVLTVYKDIAGKIPVLYMTDTWFLFGPSFQVVASPLTRRTQQFLDLGLALTGLLLSAPIMLLAAVAIRLESKGPIIFRQVRVGLNEKPYTIYKFRTMRTDAEQTTGAVWASPDDPRVTRIGKFLRRTRIDELPQIFNILLGHMSVIGPRPERPEFVARLKERIPYYPLRFLIKPGLTGWAQVNYRYGASEEDALQKLQYELYYLMERSVFLNFVILVRTIQTVLFHRGS